MTVKSIVRLGSVLILLINQVKMSGQLDEESQDIGEFSLGIENLLKLFPTCQKSPEERPISDGPIAKGFLVLLKKNPSKKATLKFILKSDSEGTQSIREGEFGVISEINHPHILKPLSGELEVKSWDGNFLYLMQPTDKSLFKLRFENDQLFQKISNSLKILFQVVLGLKAIDKKNLIHAGLTAHGVVRNEQNKFLIFDLATARRVSQNEVELEELDIYYLDPRFIREDNAELKRQVNYDQEVDIYSLGIILHYLCFRTYPFEDASKEGEIAKIKAGDYSIHSKQPIVVFLIYNMLNKEKSKRTISYTNLLEWIAFSFRKVKRNEDGGDRNEEKHYNLKNYESAPRSLIEEIGIQGVYDPRNFLTLQESGLLDKEDLALKKYFEKYKKDDRFFKLLENEFDLGQGVEKENAKLYPHLFKTASERRSLLIEKAELVV